MKEEIARRTGGVSLVTKGINSNVQDITLPNIDEIERKIKKAKNDMKTAKEEFEKQKIQYGHEKKRLERAREVYKLLAGKNLPY